MTQSRHCTIQGYIRTLSLATLTHAEYAQTAQTEIMELAKKERARGLNDAGSRDRRFLISILELQASAHVAGLTTAVAALVHLAAAGYDVPDPPDFPD